LLCLGAAAGGTDLLSAHQLAIGLHKGFPAARALDKREQPGLARYLSDYLIDLEQFLVGHLQQFLPALLPHGEELLLLFRGGSSELDLLMQYQRFIAFPARDLEEQRVALPAVFVTQLKANLPWLSMMRLSLPRVQPVIT